MKHGSYTIIKNVLQDLFFFISVTSARENIGLTANAKIMTHQRKCNI